MYENLKTLPLLLTLDQVEAHVGLSKSTIMKWIKTDTLDGFPLQRVGAVYKVNRFKLVEWLEKDHPNCETKTAAEKRKAKAQRAVRKSA